MTTENINLEIKESDLKNENNIEEKKDEIEKDKIEEEMNLSNNYNSENLNKLLDLYFKGLNMYQNTPNIDMINAFTEKSQMLLQSSKVKKILNQNKIKTKEINEIKTDSTLIDENEEIQEEETKKKRKKKENKIKKKILNMI